MEFLAVNNFGDTRSGSLAGPMGLFIIVLLSIATVLLIRNMNKRLRRLPDSFPDRDSAGADAKGAEPGGGRPRSAVEPSPRGVDSDRSGLAQRAEDAQVRDARQNDRPAGDDDPRTGA